MVEKSSWEDALRDCLHASARGDKLQMQLEQAQVDVKAYKHKLRQSHHELMLSELNVTAEWSASFYFGFVSLLEVVRDKFPSADFADL